MDTLTIPIHAERTVNQPLDFAFGPVDMAGGSLGIDFELDTTLVLNVVDSAAIVSGDTAPASAISLTPPEINLCAHATGSVGVFTARFGFTDVKLSTDDPDTELVTEAATLHACADVVFQDPDSTDGITRDEWTSHALTELADSKHRRRRGRPGQRPRRHLPRRCVADRRRRVRGRGGGRRLDHLHGREPRRRRLRRDADTDARRARRLGQHHGGDVANGLAQFVASLAGSQGEGNGPLPFLKKSLTETFDAVKPLTDYTALLTNAEVGCGTEPGDADSFPTGLTDNLATGTPVYCRARRDPARGRFRCVDSSGRRPRDARRQHERRRTRNATLTPATRAPTPCSP